MKKTTILLLSLIMVFSLNVGAVENTGIIRGEIKGNNNILSDVKIEIEELNKTEIIKDGKFEFELEHTYNKKPYTFIFEKKGYITRKIKRNIGIERLTLLNVEMEKINNKVQGKTLDNTEVKLNNKKVFAENGEYEFLDIKPGKYQLNYNKLGYEPVKKEIKIYNNKEINLPFQELVMKKIDYDTFEENTLIGNYFYNNIDLDNSFYPYYYLRENNLGNKTVGGNIKLIMSNYILSQNFKIVEFINDNGFLGENDLIESINNLIKEQPEKIKAELKLLNKFREEINQSYILEDIEEPFIYSVYHIKIKDINLSENNNQETFTSKILREKFVDKKDKKLNTLDNEIAESVEITESIKKIAELKAEEMLEYKESYLISAENESENVTFEILRQNINKNQIENIYRFFNIFDENFIRNFINPYILKAHFHIEDKWKVIFDE